MEIKAAGILSQAVCHVLSSLELLGSLRDCIPGMGQQCPLMMVRPVSSMDLNQGGPSSLYQPAAHLHSLPAPR